MRVLFLIGCLMVFLVACSGGGSSEPLQYPEDSSESQPSSVESSAGSSSETVSSVIESSSSEEYSSSETLSNSSSSVAGGSSAGLSSSAIVESSSSVGAIPCKTETEDNCEYGTLVDERDGQVYKTVKIGEQWWMAENLNYAYLQPTSTLDSSSWCYNDSAEYCEKFGRLYLWSAAIDSAGLFSDGTRGCGYFPKSEGWYRCPNDKNVLGICPEGWHLPSSNDYKKLMQNVKDMHLLLSASGEWFEGPLNTDKFGFALLPGGYYCSIHDSWECPYFGFIYETAGLWHASENGPQGAAILLGDTGTPAGGGGGDGVGGSDKYIAQSIRCIKD